MIAKILFCAALTLTTSASSGQDKHWPFKVYLDETEIGHHQFELMQRGNEQEIRSKASFDVKILRLTVYSYRHDAQERWRGDCLATLASTTDDNGERLRVQADAQQGLLRVEVNGKRSEFMQDCTQSFAYWNPAILHAKKLLHPQTGELVEVQIEQNGVENLQIGSRTVPSQRYTLLGPKMRIDLYYSAQGEWLALDAPTKGGRTLRYRLQKLPGCGMQEICT